MTELLSRDDVIRTVAGVSRRAGAVVFIGNGFNARALCALADHPDNFYMVGSMGLGPALAAGFSHCSGRPTAVLEGDGNALMGLSGYPVAVQAARAPFLHCVLDNRLYETTGGQLTLADKVDLPAVARACGYGEVHQARDLAELEQLAAAALTGSSRTFLYLRTGRQTGPKHPRVAYTPPEIAERFRRAAAEWREA